MSECSSGAGAYKENFIVFKEGGTNKIMGLFTSGKYLESGLIKMEKEGILRLNKNIDIRYLADRRIKDMVTINNAIDGAYVILIERNEVLY